MSALSSQMHATQLHFVTIKIIKLLASGRALNLPQAKAKAKERGKTIGGSETILGKPNGEDITAGRFPVRIKCVAKAYA